MLTPGTSAYHCANVSGPVICVVLEPGVVDVPLTKTGFRFASSSAPTIPVLASFPQRDEFLKSLCGTLKSRMVACNAPQSAGVPASVTGPSGLGTPVSAGPSAGGVESGGGPGASMPPPLSSPPPPCPPHAAVASTEPRTTVAIRMDVIEVLRICHSHLIVIQDRRSSRC